MLLCPVQDVKQLLTQRIHVVCMTLPLIIVPSLCSCGIPAFVVRFDFTNGHNLQKNRIAGISAGVYCYRLSILLVVIDHPFLCPLYKLDFIWDMDT